MTRKWMLIGALILALSLVGIGAAVAQETTETPTPEVTETPTLEPTPVETPVPDEQPLPGEDEPITSPGDLFEQLVQALGGTYIAWAAAGVLTVAALVKMAAYRFFNITIDGTRAVALSLVLQVLVWATYSIAAAAGKGDLYKQWYLAAIELARSFLPFVGALFAGQFFYDKARQYNVPLVSYKPPARPNMIRG